MLMMISQCCDLVAFSTMAFSLSGYCSATHPGVKNVARMPRSSSIFKIRSTPLVIPYCPRDSVFGISLQVGSNCSQNSSAFRLMVIMALHFLFSGHFGLSSFILISPPVLVNGFDTSLILPFLLPPRHPLWM